jgi:hypothetical protein
MRATFDVDFLFFGCNITQTGSEKAKKEAHEKPRQE